MHAEDSQVRYCKIIRVLSSLTHCYNIKIDIIYSSSLKVGNWNHQFHVTQTWPIEDGALEFWYGGRLYVSRPGSTPFGEPVEKRFMGVSVECCPSIGWDISWD